MNDDLKTGVPVSTHGEMVWRTSVLYSFRVVQSSSAEQADRGPGWVAVCRGHHAGLSDECTSEARQAFFQLREAFDRRRRHRVFRGEFVGTGHSRLSQEGTNQAMLYGPGRWGQMA